MNRSTAATLAVFALAGALPSLRGCGSGTAPTEASGADVAAFVEILVPAIASSGCPKLSRAARQFEKNTGVDVRFEKEAREFQRFVDAAPVEIRGDFQTFADAYSTWAKALARLDRLDYADPASPTPETLQDLQGISIRIDRRKLARATHHIVAWMDENCAGGA